jgi:nicotinamide phosphoribosyltransferase
MINPMLLCDGYKTGHRIQFPKGTELVYSNFTARGSRMPGVDHVVVFGVQYFLTEYLVKQFNEEFFK